MIDGVAIGQPHSQSWNARQYSPTATERLHIGK